MWNITPVVSIEITSMSKKQSNSNFNAQEIPTSKSKKARKTEENDFHLFQITDEGKNSII